MYAKNLERWTALPSESLALQGAQLLRAWAQDTVRRRDVCSLSVVNYRQSYLFCRYKSSNAKQPFQGSQRTVHPLLALTEASACGIPTHSPLNQTPSSSLRSVQLASSWERPLCWVRGVREGLGCIGDCSPLSKR